MDTIERDDLMFMVGDEMETRLVRFLNERRNANSEFLVTVYNNEEHGDEKNPNTNTSPAKFDTAEEAVEFAETLRRVLKGSVVPESFDPRYDVIIVLEITNYKEVEEDYPTFEGDVWFFVKKLDRHFFYFTDIVNGALTR